MSRRFAHKRHNAEFHHKIPAKMSVPKHRQGRIRQNQTLPPPYARHLQCPRRLNEFPVTRKSFRYCRRKSIKRLSPTLPSTHPSSYGGFYTLTSLNHTRVFDDFITAFEHAPSTRRLVLGTSRKLNAKTWFGIVTRAKYRAVVHPPGKGKTVTKRPLTIHVIVRP